MSRKFIEGYKLDMEKFITNSYGDFFLRLQNVFCGPNIFQILKIFVDYLIKVRDVNGAGKVRVVAPPYNIRWINIRPVPVLISVGYPLYAGTHLFFSYPRISTGTRRYLQNYLKNKYLIINSNKIK